MQEMAVDQEVEDTTKKGGGFLLLVFPTVFLNGAHILAAVVLTDLIVYRTCLVSLDINSTDCLILRTNSGSPEAADLEAKVEPHASVIVMTKTLVEGILPVVITLFFGPWSDRGGRKPLLLAVSSGFTLEYLILSLMCSWNISPWYLIFALIPANIVGGIPVARLASICYISDTTTAAQRTLQLTLLQISTAVGLMLGGLTAPSIYKNYGYTCIFSTAVACSGSTLVFIYFCISETVQDASKESIRGLFKISSVKEILTSCLMKRVNFQRSIVWLAIFIVTVNILIYHGEQTTEFLFTRARLGWDVQHYSYFIVANFFLSVTGLCGVLLRSRVPGFTDTVLAGLGLVSALGSTITISLAWQSWHMYLAVCIGVFNEISITCMRSVISKNVPAPDVGKVFSLAAVLEMLSTFVGAPIYTLIYSNYLPPIYPSPVYLLSTGVYALLIICVTSLEMLIRKFRKPPTYTATAQEDF